MTEIEHNGTVAMTDTQAGIAGNVTNQMVDAFLSKYYGARTEYLSHLAEEVRSALSAALSSQPAQPVQEPVDSITDAVIAFLVKNDFLDVRDEYDVSDVVGALQDNYEPAPSQEPVAVVKALPSPADLRDNDAVWARFYRDGKTLGEICAEFQCGVYALSPWLTAPLVRAAMPLVNAQAGKEGK